MERGKRFSLIGANGSGKDLVLFKYCAASRNLIRAKSVYAVATQDERPGFPDNVGVFINSPGYPVFTAAFQNPQIPCTVNIQRKIGERKLKEL